MDAKGILIVTTFRLSDISQVSSSLNKWNSEKSASMCALIEEAEYLSNPSKIEQLKDIIDIIVPYRLEVDNGIDAGFSKKSPRITDVLEAMKRLKGFRYYAFTNADIEWHGQHEKADPYKIIDELSNGQKAIFAHRRDYSSDPRDFKCYMQGLDFFALPNRVLDTIGFSQELSFFQIGQVGWDYALPLSLPSSQVSITRILPIYHKTHATGSNTDWSEAIVNTMPFIHPTWTRNNPIMKFALHTTNLLVARLGKARSTRSGKERLKNTVYYFASRILFYGFIKKAILRDKIREV